MLGELEEELVLAKSNSDLSKLDSLKSQAEALLEKLNNVPDSPQTGLSINNMLFFIISIAMIYIILKVSKLSKMN